MKFLFIIICTFLLNFSFNASATTVESLYQSCKPYQSSGFKPSIDAETTRCISTLRAYVDAGRESCVELKWLYRDMPKRKLYIEKLNEKIANSNPKTLYPVIISFINWAENNPKSWIFEIRKIKTDFLHKVFPCDFELLPGSND